MGKTFTFDNVEYDLETLSSRAQTAYAALEFAKLRGDELTNLLAVMTKAKNAYLDELKQEILLKRGGFL